MVWVVVTAAGPGGAGGTSGALPTGFCTMAAQPRGAAFASAIGFGAGAVTVACAVGDVASVGPGAEGSGLAPCTSVTPRSPCCWDGVGFVGSLPTPAPATSAAPLEGTAFAWPAAADSLAASG